MRRLPSYLALLVVLALTHPALAQDIQIAFDEGEQLFVIDVEQANRLGLFSEYDGFREARLYDVGGGRYELVVEREEEGRRLRERETLDIDELAALRRRVEAALAAAGGRVRLDQEGRRKLLVTTTLFGGLYGILLPMTFGVEDEQVYGSVPLFGMGVGFFVPFYRTRNSDVTEAQATMTLYGGVQGAVHGVLLSTLIAGERISPELGAGMTLAASAAQAGLGHFRAADEWALSAGTGETMALGSIYGLFMGAGAAALLLGDDELDDDGVARLVSGLMLLGSSGGIYGSYRLAQTERFTQGDARIAALLTSFGLQVGTVVVALADVEDVRPGAVLVISTTTGGLAAGRYFVRGRDFSRSQANIIALGSWAGGLIGGALSVAMNMSSNLSLVVGNLGTAAGFALTYGTFAGDVRTAEASGWRLQVHPEALLAQRMLERAGRPFAAVPAVTLSRSF